MALPESPATFETFELELGQLADRFDRDYPQSKSPEYHEVTLRADFLGPIFRTLGWDVGNTKDLFCAETDVDTAVRLVA